jgi:hypothetical protein
MMQSITCNKSSLFALRQKTSELFFKNKYFAKQNKILNVFEWETLIHSYMKLRHEQHCNVTWIEFISYLN